MKLLAVAAIALLLPQEKNEAEELFKKMEEKIAKAKSVRMTFEVSLDPEGAKLTGELLLDEGNRARWHMEGKKDGVFDSGTLTSDGTRALMLAGGVKNRPFDVPESMGRLMRLSLARSGFLGLVDASHREEKAKADPATAFIASGFKLGAKEKVGDRESQAIDYTLSVKGNPDASMTVWVDRETNLPLKRTFRSGSRKRDETYTAFTLDPKIDPAKFELPKENK